MEQRLPSKNIVLWFVLMILIALQIQCCRGCLNGERTALLELKAAFRGSSDHVFDSWPDDTRSDCCRWDRVSCSSSSRHVVELVLDGCFRSTGLPVMNLSLFHPFEELKRLYLNNNRFFGFIDPIEGLKSFGRMKRLEILNLGNNRFSRSVFQFLSAATHLKNLTLSGNIIDGVFPPKGLANMTSLRRLDLSYNKFSILSPEGSWGLMKLKALDLSNNQLTGDPQMQGNEPCLQARLHSGICNLKNLQELDLSNNRFSGSLPHCLTTFKQLRVLDLTSNQLIGNPQPVVQKLTSLKYISLYDNDFKGVFSFGSLFNNSNLRVFRLSSKPGMIQLETESFWQPNFQLEAIQIRNCSFNTKYTPRFLLGQSELRFIDLSHNNLVGSIPVWLIQNNSKLEALYLMNNSFTGFQIPENTHGLLHLDVSANNLTGSLPENLHIILPKIQCLNFSRNSFHGGIPPTMGELKSLEILDLSYNKMFGELPRELLAGSCPLKFLKLSGNHFQGRVFPTYANLTQLLWLYTDQNNFTGSLEKGLLNSVGLITLDASRNILSGRIPDWIGKFRSLEFLLMCQNRLEGHIPIQITNLDRLQILDLSQNSLSGFIPSTFNFSRLCHLHLQKNELIGPIPDAIFNSRLLVTLDMRSNRLSGNISKRIGDLSRLSILLLRANQISGSIPNKICGLRELNFLDLSSNRLNGSIRTCISNMSFGISGGEASSLDFQGVLNFEDENLGTYYRYASSLALPLVYADYMVFNTRIVVEFETKRRYESFEGAMLPYIFGLDLSSNRLTGGIPMQIGDLRKLNSLNLSHNCLSGPIPESISNMKKIESLDFSSNRLFGPIPPEISGLYGLSIFDVSYNNLSGPIPYTGQFLTFDESNYVGNAGLCGLPTNRSCVKASEVSAPIACCVGGVDDGLDLDMAWFCWSFGVTYAVVLLGILTILCTETRWSRAWFDLVDACIHRLQQYIHL